MKNISYSSDPNEKNQKEVQNWWEQNPMTYDWEELRDEQEGTKEWFKKVDNEFWEISKTFAHPNWPKDAPFSSLIDFQNLKGKKVLEIGCGTGAHAALFANAGANITAIDLTEKATELTKKRFDLFQIKDMAVLNCDAEKLPFPDNSFDFVWSWGVIHHSANTQKIIKEILRVLKPKGKTSLMVYNRNSTRYWVYGLYMGIIKGRFFRNRSLYAVNMTYTDGHIAKHYTKKEAKVLFEDFHSVNLRAIEDGPVPSMFFGWGRLSRIFPMLFNPINKFINKRWGWFLFIEAKK
jgi:ubiquinone/menaquinone biosynthesis C-methylase UbiE